MRHFGKTQWDLLPVEEIPPEPVLAEEWNTARGEYTTTVTFASDAKYAVRQNAADEWEIHGPGNFYMTFATEQQATLWLTDIEHWGW